MATIPSLFGHIGEIDAASAGLVNNQLARAVATDQPLLLNGVELLLRQFHVGPGEYRLGARATTHVHAELQIEYGISGAFCFHDSHHAHLLEPGGALLAAPQVPHSWTCERPGVMIGALLQISGARAGAFIQHLHRQSAEGLVAVTAPTQAQDLASLWQMLAESPAGTWREDRVAAQVRLLFARTLSAAYDLARWYDSRPAAQADSARAEVTCKRAIDFMQANFARAIGLPDVALHAGVSTRHLSRLFRQQRGCTVNHALLRIRLARARDLLDQRQMTVKEVAYACGFSSPAYFTQCYRRQHGRVPSAVLAAQAPAPRR